MSDSRDPDESRLPPPPTFEEIAARSTAAPTAPTAPSERYTPIDLTTGRPCGGPFAVLGRGGLGEVLAAWDRSLERPVAIKVLSAAASPARFLQEARLAAQLSHPVVVPIHDTGRWHDGRLYYAMRWVRGQTLGAALAGCDGLPARLRLLGNFAGVCQALAYAHSQGVTHRDIKPDNIMVGQFGETQLLDWGIARRSHAPEEEGSVGEAGSAIETAAGSLLGTPAYMSPEQAAGRIDQVDARSDVWSLGVVLAELLSGQRLVQAETLPELLAAVRRGPRPVLPPEVAPELAAIVERALQRDPADRYPDAGELAADIEAFRSGALVGAYDYTLRDHLRRFGARNRRPLLVAAAAAVALGVVGVASLDRIISERDRALAAEALAEQGEADALDKLGDALELQAKKAWQEGDLAAAWLFAAGALQQGERLDARGIITGATRRWSPQLTGSIRERCTELVRSRGATACRRQAAARTWRHEGQVLDLDLTALSGSTPGIYQLALSPDGSHLAVATSADGLVLVSLADGSRHPLPGTAQSPYAHVLFSDDGETLYAQSGSFSLGIALEAWSVAERRLLARRPALPHAHGLALLDGGRLLSASSGVLTIFSAQLDALEQIVAPNTNASSPRFSRDSGRIALASHDGRMWIRQLSGGEWLSIPVEGGQSFVEWAPGGRVLAARMDTGAVALYDAETGRRLFRFAQEAHDIAFAPDGSLLLARADGPTQVWSLGDLDAAVGLLGSDGAAIAVEQVPGRPWLLGLFPRGARSASLWRADSGALIRTLAQDISRISAAPDGQHALISQETLGWLDLETGAIRPLPIRQDYRLVWLDDARIGLPAGDGTLPLYAAADGAPLGSLPLPYQGFVPMAVVAGEVIVNDVEPGLLWRLSPGSRRAVRLPLGDPLVLYSSDNYGQLAIGEQGGHLALIDLEGEAVLARWRGHPSRARRVASKGDLFASADDTHIVHLWSLEDPSRPRLLARLDGGHSRLHVVDFINERDLLTTGMAGRVNLWDLGQIDTPAEKLLEDARSRFGVTLRGAELTDTDTRLLDAAAVMAP